jgi:alkylglycerol monooxygenase
VTAMEDVIVYALPVFGALMALEFGLGLARGRNTYGFADTLANLSQGLLSQVVAACTQLIQVGLYALAFPHLTLTPHAALWGHWEGAALAVLLYDFCDYWLHRVSHESAIFWAAHVVHHQSRHFNLSTALRQESAYNLSGWMFFLPMAVVGVPPAQFALAGVVVLFYQFWIHTEQIGSLGVLDRILSTPSNHRVHHATNARYLDRNYGAILVVWDRMFGSFEPESEPCVYGTTTPLASWDPLVAAGGPYVELWRKAGRMHGWRDRVRAVFKGPGWEPEGCEPCVDAGPVEAARADIAATAAQRGVAVALFLLVTAGTAAFLALGDPLGAWATGGVASCLVVGLWAIAAVLERRVGPIAGALLGVLATGGVALVLVL